MYSTHYWNPQRQRACTQMFTFEHICRVNPTSLFQELAGSSHQSLNKFFVDRRIIELTMTWVLSSLDWLFRHGWQAPIKKWPHWQWALNQSPLEGFKENWAFLIKGINGSHAVLSPLLLALNMHLMIYCYHGSKARELQIADIVPTTFLATHFCYMKIIKSYFWARNNLLTSSKIHLIDALDSAWIFCKMS